MVIESRAQTEQGSFMSAIGEELRKNLVAIEDERKEACIHCKKVWYSIHYRDGVCHSCQQLNKPGRTQLFLEFVYRLKVVCTTLLFILFVTILHFFGLI